MHKYDKQRYKLAYKKAAKDYLEAIFTSRRNSLLGFIIPALGSVFVFYIPPLIAAHLIQALIDHRVTSLSQSIPYIALFGILWLIGESFWRIGTEFMIKAEAAGVKKLANDSMKNILRNDVDFFINNFSGSLAKKTNGYIYRLVDVMDTLMFNVFSAIIPAVFALIVLAIYSPYLSLMLLGWIVIALFVAFPLIVKRKKLIDIREAASNVVSGHIADIYTNVEAVRAHANEHNELSTHNRHVEDHVGKLVKSWEYQNRRVDMTISPIYVMANVSGLLLSVYLAFAGTLNFATILVVFAYYAEVTRFMWEFNGIYRRLEASLSDAAQFTELILDEPKISDPIEPSAKKVGSGSINFKEVRFGYSDDEIELFDKFNLEIKSGEKIGLIGRSGGGKTSITKLLLRFLDIDNGSIEIDNVPIKQMSQKNLRSLIAYVPQDPIMFHRSIRENIAYSKQNATDSEVELVAKLAHCHEFIKDLPKGYDTLVGERGVKLSGGQRQRVAIARAMLKDAPILVLDEATSALDSESEVLIQDALKKLMKGKTAIVIAHRLSTIQNMDRIIVLDEGKIVEDGTHKELLAKDGTYAKLWAHQSGGFLED